jgi:hypothetical protein
MQIDCPVSDPHPEQKRFIYSKAKRKVIKAGRRGGKTVGAAIMACVRAFEDLEWDSKTKQPLKDRRVLYAAPTSEQTDRFWTEVKKILQPVIDKKYLHCNETERFIELPGTEARIKAKTSWNANTLRGDYAALLILDEFQLMDEDTWDEVGAPMLADNNGDAVFIFTPPSLNATGISRAKDPRHASKLFKKAKLDTTGLWQTFHFTSFDNPYISHEALTLIASDMSLESYRREIMAEDDEIEQSWLVHGKFNESLCKIKRFNIPFNWDVYSGHDFGSANPAALFIARVRLPLPQGAPLYMRLNDLVAFREYAPGAGYSIPQHVNRFNELSHGYSVVKRVGGNQTTEDEIRQGYTAHGWSIMAPTLTKVNAQLDRVIGLEELNKLYIFDDMLGILVQIANCMWELDDTNKPLNKIKWEDRYHLLACLRYIGSDFTPETVVSRKREVSFSYF